MVCHRKGKLSMFAVSLISCDLYQGAYSPSLHYFSAHIHSTTFPYIAFRQSLLDHVPNSWLFACTAQIFTIQNQILSLPRSLAQCCRNLGNYLLPTRILSCKAVEASSEASFFLFVHELLTNCGVGVCSWRLNIAWSCHGWS